MKTREAAIDAMSTDCRIEGEAVLGESPMAKPANHDPSVNMVCPDPDSELVPEPEYPVPEYP